MSYKTKTDSILAAKLAKASGFGGQRRSVLKGFKRDLAKIRQLPETR